MVGRLTLLITYYIAAIVDGNVTGTNDIATYQRIHSGQGPSLILNSCTQDRFIQSQKIHTLEQKSSHYELIEVQKGLQCICQAKTVIGSSITPTVALLVHISGIIHPILDCHEFTRSHIC